MILTHMRSGSDNGQQDNGPAALSPTPSATIPIWMLHAMRGGRQVPEVSGRDARARRSAVLVRQTRRSDCTVPRFTLEAQYSKYMYLLVGTGTTCTTRYSNSN
eukprot:COSAG02_NODE_2342_length_9101_cov_78.830038_9_plen_103_part_00